VPLTSLICEIEAAIASRSGETGAMLRRITDLFLLQAGHYSADQLAVYDDILRMLIANVDVVARAKLAERIALVKGAPPNTIRSLALDAAPEVAQSVLARSELDDATLIECIATNGQDHMLAIATRDTVSGPVSDHLVSRGNNNVLGKLAGNPGAAISDEAFRILVEKSTGDDWLSELVGRRPDIPERHFRELMSKASEIVRQRLIENNPEHRALIEEMFARDQVQNHDDETRPKDYRTAELVVDSRPLTETTVHAFARAHRIEEVIVSVARLSGLPITDTERLIMGPWGSPVVVLFKAIGFRLATFEAIYRARGTAGPVENDELARVKPEFVGLGRGTAERILRFYRTRRKVEVPDAAALD
jgi:uncharacterized protein (DUF2336 family)